MLKVVATSTVAAAVPIAPPVARLAIVAWAVNKLAEALVSVEPVARVSPPVMLAPPDATVIPVRPVSVPVMVELPVMLAPPLDTVSPVSPLSAPPLESTAVGVLMKLV